MTKLTIQKSNHPPKHYSNPSTHQNTNSISKSISKRVKNREFVHPNNVHEIDSDTDEAEIEVIPEVIKDVSDIQFIIIRYCLFDSDPILEDTNFIKFDEFNY